jgi:hypothetical protein
MEVAIFCGCLDDQAAETISGVSREQATSDPQLLSLCRWEIPFLPQLSGRLLDASSKRMQAHRELFCMLFSRNENNILQSPETKDNCSYGNCVQP